jgi:uncharacterized membrane protein HdeD (DUF308 family)
MKTLGDVIGGLGKGARYLGAALIGLGLVVALLPTVSGAFVILPIGLVLLLAGLVCGAFGWRAWSGGKGPLGLVMGGLASACGLLLVLNPVSSLETVVLVVAVYFALDGASEVLLGFQLMPEDGWPWMVGNGVLSILLGLSLWYGWPLAGVRALGLLLGVKLASAGAVMLRVERTMTRLGERAAAAHARLATRPRERP